MGHATVLSYGYQWLMMPSEVMVMYGSCCHQGLLRVQGPGAAGVCFGVQGPCGHWRPGGYLHITIWCLWVMWLQLGAILTCIKNHVWFHGPTALGSVLMTVACITTESQVDVCGLCWNVKPFWCPKAAATGGYIDVSGLHCYLRTFCCLWFGMPLRTLSVSMILL